MLADVEPEQPHVELARSIGTRLGEGLGEHGRLADEPMQRTLDAVVQLTRALRGHYVRLFAIGTSALRRAENGDELAEQVKAILGVPLRVLSGEEEAAASYRGALTAFGRLRGEHVAVCDVGGGSTECAVGDSLVPEKVVSCEIGAVRLTESVPALSGNDGAVNAPTLKRARELAREALEPLSDCSSVERVALVGGSATTTAAIVAGKRLPPASRTLTRPDLQRTLERLLPMNLAERKAVVGMKAQRADILPAGIVVLDEALETLGKGEAVATTADLLLGTLLQERDAAGMPPRPPAALGPRRSFRA